MVEIPLNLKLNYFFINLTYTQIYDNFLKQVSSIRMLYNIRGRLEGNTYDYDDSKILYIVPGDEKSGMLPRLMASH